MVSNSALKIADAVATHQSLEDVSKFVRGKIVEMSMRARAPHLGSALSCVDILVAAYWSALNVHPGRPDDPDRDRLILSKGHAAMALYAVLAQRGFFGDELLATFNRDGGKLAEHPGPQCAPGVEAATGSLGHGLSLGVGMVLAGRLRRLPYRAFVVMSDGECNEGSVWEAASLAAAHRLENLCTIVDFNEWQATGRSTEITFLKPLASKFEAFGWSAYEIDGHDLSALTDVLSNVPDGSGKPVAIVANTVKGKGVSFMEDDNNWHYRIPTEDEVERAYRELGLK